MSDVVFQKNITNPTLPQKPNRMDGVRTNSFSTGFHCLLFPRVKSDAYLRRLQSCATHSAHNLICHFENMKSFEIAVLFIILLIAVVLAENRDFYKILEVSKQASDAEIKKAYRKKSLKFHPDKNPSPDAAEKFAEIGAAYEVLSDKEKRAVYDRGGEDAVKQQEQRSNQPSMDPFSIFEAFGFGGMGGRRQQHNEEPRTANAEIPFRVSLKQLYTGDLLDVSYKRQVLCMNAKSCEKNSKECQGPGIKMKVQQLAPGFVQQVQVQDASCVAKGKAWKSPCKACPNGATEDDEIQLVIDLQAGMMENDVVKFEQVTDEAVGHIAGDLIFKIIQEPHDIFTRSGDDLHMALKISLLDSLVGFKTTVVHLDNHIVEISKSDVTYCSEVMKIPDEGMPKKSGKGKGDLYVTFLIDFPRDLTASQKASIQNILNN